LKVQRYNLSGGGEQILFKILVLPIGNIQGKMLEDVCRALKEVYKAICKIHSESLPVPKEAYVPERKQYLASYFVSIAEEYAKKLDFTRVIAITDVNLFVPGLNFVFGQANLHGRGAVVSFFMLRPEVYGDPPNMELLSERVVKTVIHEIGHTLGLGHCSNPRCVMKFSNHVGETDFKTKRFCLACRKKIEHVLKQYMNY